MQPEVKYYMVNTTAYRPRGMLPLFGALPAIPKLLMSVSLALNYSIHILVLYI